MQNVRNHLGSQSRTHWDADHSKPERVFSEVIIVEFGRFETREAVWLLHSAVPALAPEVPSDAASEVLGYSVSDSSIGEAETGHVEVLHTDHSLRKGYCLV